MKFCSAIGGTRGKFYRQEDQIFVASRYLFCVSQSVASGMFIAAIGLEIVIRSNQHHASAVKGTSTLKDAWSLVWE